MIAGTRRHVGHHGRFYLAAAAAALVWAGTIGDDLALRAVLAGDMLFLVYLTLTARVVFGAGPDAIRAKAEYDDEGIAVIIVLALATIASTLAAIFALASRTDPVPALHLALAILSVLLGWATLHTIYALRYAHLYYRRGHAGDARGLAFPGTHAPTMTDFLYHAFVIGMTAQVSDVQVETPGLRRLVLVHSVLSFLFNTVLLALAVNIAAGLAH